MKTTKSSGFSLPIIIIVAASTIMVILTLLTTTQSTRSYLTNLYYVRLAEEAAEAGATYAEACLEINNRIQTWGNTPSTYLTQSSDCTGNQAAFPNNSVIALSNELQSRFTVGNLEQQSSGSVQIAATGYVDVKYGGGSVVAHTYIGSVKKTVTWATDLVSSRSVSGTNRTCAIMSGSVYCWGYNAYGQLGNGQYLGTGNIESSSSIDSNIPVKVKKEAGKLSGKVVVDLFAAQYHSCALTSDGKVYCWGYNAQGQLGNGTFTSNGAPYEVGGALASKVVTAIGGSANTSCAITEGKIYCWGSNTNGLLGNNVGSGSYNTPQPVVAGNTSTTLPSTYTATAISTSGSRSNTLCAIANGKAYCWGNNYVGEVGDGTSNNKRNLPTKVVDTGVLSGKTVTAISQDGYPTEGNGGVAHVCAVASGAVYCWGRNNYGQLGRAINSTADSKVPVAVYTGGVLSGKIVTDVAVGLRHTCVLASGEVYCWGIVGSGQVGDNSFSGTLRYVPVKVYQEAGGLLGATITKIGAGANRGCAVVADGKSFCWGLNNSGQIGDGTFINRAKPTESLFLRPKNNEYIF